MSIFKNQISKYIREINNLSLWLNMNTDLCVFVSNSGHTEQIDVSIRESKKHFYKEIKTFGFYYSEGGKAYFDDINTEVRTATEEAKACVKYLHELIKDSKSNHVKH